MALENFLPEAEKESESFISFVYWLSENSLSRLVRRLNSFFQDAFFPWPADKGKEDSVDDICLTREGWLW